VSGHASVQLDPNERTTLDALGRVGFIASLIVGVAGLVLAAAISAGDWTLFGHAYLTGYVYFLTISCAALFFVIVQHLTRAGWSVTIRRIAELMAMNLPMLLLLVVPILAMHGSIYEWVHPNPDDPLMAHKSPWLNSNFFIVRVVFYLVVLSGLAWWVFNHSRTQDEDGDVRHTKTLQAYSGLCVVIFALIGSALSFDLVMTLNPEWYSTIYAVYLFAGGMMGLFAWLILVLRFLQSRGILTSSVNTEHYHDLGKWLFGFVFFWSYIAYSQYMLQWYAAIPEEQSYYHQRGATTNDAVSSEQSGPWPIVSLLLLFGHSLIPFAGLLSRWSKRWGGLLIFWALWLAVFHLVDMTWVVMPALQYHDHVPSFGAQIAVVLCSFVGIGGLWLASSLYWATKGSVLARRDPRLGEALAHENY